MFEATQRPLSTRLFFDLPTELMTEPTALPPVFFNHLYIVLDDKTYRAIQGSDFLQIAFPGLERRGTLTAAGETWYGTYFYCQDNYLEFFGVSNGPFTGSAARSGHWQAGAQEGWAGLAFSSDTPGGVSAVRSMLRETQGSEPFSELRKVQVGGKPINWFYHVRLSDSLRLGSFESWVMEYHPEVFALKNIPIPASGELSRQAYLSPWNKARAVDHGDRAVKDASPHPSAPKKETSATLPPGGLAQPVFTRVTGATIHMDASRAERYASILELLGYQKETVRNTISLSAHGFSLVIEPEDRAPQGYRLSSLRLAMARPSVAPMTFIFAPRSRLVLNENLTAEWFFGE